MKKKISDEYTLFGIIKETLTSNHHNDVLLSSNDFDDCALIKMTDDYSLAITSDFVRGSGFYLFELGYLDYFDVGYYLIGANLSDIAAMGAEALGVNTVIRYSKNMDDSDFRRVFEGMNEICRENNVSIIGGDIGGHSSDVFSATAFGKIKTKNVLRRNNVADGDILCVTGEVGNAIAALTYLKDIKEDSPILTVEEEEYLLKSWKRVTPRLKEGQLLSENFDRIACQDISDGLKATILQMSQLSGKTFTIYESNLPVSKIAHKVAEAAGIDSTHLALSASVDFELLFSIPEKELSRAKELFQKSQSKIIPIGRVNNNSANILETKNGEITPIPGIEWKQQATDFIKDILS
ncbi:MAG: thiamine-phosphate kinase [Algicola sp.]|nr:thiamine-phosphate kinase [Algicola sp.]